MFTDFQFDSRLHKALQALDFDKPTEVQERVIPSALSGEDLLVSAATGTGKTAAYLLPAIHSMLTNKGPAQGTRVLILAPTRELVQQIVRDSEKFCRFSALKADQITGGVEFKYQHALLRKDPEILVATPGRLVEHLNRGTPDFNHLEALIIDEADRMLDLGFQDDVLRICDSCPQTSQRILISATLENPAVEIIAKQILKTLQRISLNKNSAFSLIKQQLIFSDNDRHKDKQLLSLLNGEPESRTLVFSRTRKNADRLHKLLTKSTYKAEVIHSELTQEQRNLSMRRYHQGLSRILIATDVVARGIDVENIDLVINYNIAANTDDYTHRIGRTGRAGSEGRAISLVSQDEYDTLRHIERSLGIALETRSLSGLGAHFKGGAVKSDTEHHKKKQQSESKETISRDSVHSKKVKAGGKKGSKGKKPLLDGFEPVKKKIK